MNKERAAEIIIFILSNDAIEDKNNFHCPNKFKIMVLFIF